MRARFNVRVDSAGPNYRYKVELTIYVALQRLREQVDMLKGSRLVVSSNVQTRRDGLPLSKATEPKDPAVAVYFVWRGKTRAFPSDKWDRVADNIGAVAAHLDAIRRIERYAVGEVEQVFEGYKALPAVGAKAMWWTVLGFQEGPPAFVDSVLDKWRELIRKAHPDQGGSANQAAEINAAKDEAVAYYERLR